MGLREDNTYIQLHRQGGWPGFIREIRLHRGDSGIDRTATIPPASWSSLVTAANTGDAAVFDIVTGLPGGSGLLADLGPTGVSSIRQLVLDLDAH